MADSPTTWLAGQRQESSQGSRSLAPTRRRDRTSCYARAQQNDFVPDCRIERRDCALSPSPGPITYRDRARSGDAIRIAESARLRLWICWSDSRSRLASYGAAKLLDVPDCLFWGVALPRRSPAGHPGDAHLPAGAVATSLPAATGLPLPGRSLMITAGSAGESPIGRIRQL